MRLNHVLGLILVFCAGFASAQNGASELSFSISVDQEIRDSFMTDGRIFLFLSDNERREPRFAYVDNDKAAFAKNITDWSASESLTIKANDIESHTSEWNLNNVPPGEYYVQAVWVQYKGLDVNPNSEGNLYGDPVKVNVIGKQVVQLSLSKIIPGLEVTEHHLVKEFAIKSELLSAWWNKDVEVKAAVLLPSGYDKNPEKKYPVRYNVAGYGGRYTRINRVVSDAEFMNWWTGTDAPQIVTVFLDGNGPFGDNYQLDSENSGPYGQALITELIPAVEREFRISGTADTRFVDGCSTGGWVSLALQLYYPDSFNGCWSYSPDPVTFQQMQLVNLYEDENAFYNSAGYLTPSMRDTKGAPRFSIKAEVTWENVFGHANSYTTSGQQWGAWNALYSQKGKDGLPAAIFDPENGQINNEVAEHWKKYDLLLHTKNNWADLGPKIQDKVHIWMGDMDNFYLNNAMRLYDEFLKTTTDPVSNAEVVFTPMEGHCSLYSHRKILEEISKRLEEIGKSGK